MFNTAYLGSILLRRLAVALHQRRFLGFYSEGEGCCTGNDSGAVCPAILRYDSGFPFSGSEGFLGCEAEAGNGIDDQFSGTDGVVFAGIETAESETDIRVVAHQSEPLSVNGDLRWLAGRDAVVRFGIVCLFRGDSCTDEGRERVGRRLLGMDVFDLAVGGALLQAGRGLEAGLKAVQLGVELRVDTIEFPDRSQHSASEAEIDILSLANSPIEGFLHGGKGGNQQFFVVGTSPLVGNTCQSFDINSGAPYDMSLTGLDTREGALCNLDEGLCALDKFRFRKFLIHINQ